MGTKTISIMDDAYEMLKRSKVGNESFTDVIRRDYAKKKRPMDFCGVWSKETAETVERLISEGRERSKKRDIWSEKY